ncbi:hypothetical protein WA1_47180 [Scytonema hofmannii PCC 7110]|uniref:Terpene synthase n=1 Tax=Scytonema hofmannii PCC 7110 TaxID=128403 RepID=A0A139WXP3_9CYAN|nr:hypothetical protein [Scytonema hofmannii]KYC37214.1 hypothetical protein WA1_47180 [Scytonema hofmannii PCC 7110]
MSMLFIPWLYVPFPEEINENAEAVEERTLEWAFKFKFIKGNQHYHHFRAAKYGQLVDRACPKATIENSVILSDLMTFFFLLDDQFDDQHNQAKVGSNPDKLRVVFSQLLDVMKQPSLYATDANPSLAGLSDIWQRIYQRASSDLVERLLNDFQDYFETNIWQAENRARNIIPNLDTYIKTRRITCGFPWCLTLGEIVQEINLPSEVHEYDEVQTLFRLADHVCGWLNDIVSLEVELKCGEIHNLVLVLQQEYQLTLQEAVNRAAEMWTAELQAFMTLEQQLPSFGTAVDIELGRYIASMRYWMRATEHWQYQSERYRTIVPTKSLQPVSA